MKDLFEFLSDNIYEKDIFLETVNMIVDETINESFQASILTELAKRIKDAEKEHADQDKKEEQRYKEEGRGYKPTKTAKTFASIFGPLTETPRWGDKKTGIRGLKWSEIKDSDFKQYKGDDKEFVKFLKSVYAKKAIADMIVCAPGTKDIVCFIKGYAKTLGDVRVYYFATEGWKKGVQEKTEKKYKYDVRSLKVNETLELIKDFDVYVLEVTESMIKDYDELHKDRTDAQKGSIEMDEASMKTLLKQQKARYDAMVKEIKAKKLQDDPNILFNDIKKANDDVVALFQKVMSKPENMDMRFDLSDLMRYVSYAYEQFYKSMKSLRTAKRSEDRYGKGYGKYDKERSDEEIRDAKEYLEKVNKMVKEIEDQLK